MPLLLIGCNKENRYEASAWDAALSAASYPLSNQLPKTYRNEQTAAAAPVTKSAAANTAKENAGNMPKNTHKDTITARKYRLPVMSRPDSNSKPQIPSEYDAHRFSY